VLSLQSKLGMAPECCVDATCVRCVMRRVVNSASTSRQTTPRDTQTIGVLCSGSGGCLSHRDQSVKIEALPWNDESEFYVDISTPPTRPRTDLRQDSDQPSWLREDGRLLRASLEGEHEALQKAVERARLETQQLTSNIWCTEAKNRALEEQNQVLAEAVRKVGTFVYDASSLESHTTNCLEDHYVAASFVEDRAKLLHTSLKIGQRMEPIISRYKLKPFLEEFEAELEPTDVGSTVPTESGDCVF